MRTMGKLSGKIKLNLRHQWFRKAKLAWPLFGLRVGCLVIVP